VRFKTKIGQHDLDLNAKTIGKMLSAGDKVKVSVLFRGREITHPEIGRELLQRVATNLGAAANVEKQPSMEGRFMNMILAPVAPKPPPKPKQPRAERPPREEAPAEPPQDGAMATALRESGVVDSEPPPAS
jgi:translation initiation factor IF-3